ncbi:tRNA pseudouridine(38-40) synthase TruA [Carboxylicivirga caseinilyticus]|uniref:tRNA pseudouridine(38-40) synthase TruA n=1 Tax=Carboxylicivirga caseinilyticus TaxID=3417572 RepID=UPI003D32916B|nr:tRNA pseudouridine(38-40) synthase TruA [Marinilabiliaceae bacterium A049]
MPRYFMEMAYNGQNYHGWQIQPNAISVQEVINDALYKAIREEVNVVGAGRTDTGVHASYFVCHFDCEQIIGDTDFILHRLNRILRNDVVVYTLFPVNDDAHSRFGAVSRTYHYYLKPFKTPFFNDIAYRPTFNVDITKMNEAARKLFDYTDFTSFSKLHTDTKTNNCKIMQAQWVDKEDMFVFVIKADRFLRNMVRAIVGTLLEVGRGKMSINQFCEIIEAKDRSMAGTSVPPQALFLVDVEYPEELFQPIKKKPPVQVDL